MSYTALHPQFVQYGTDGRGRDTYIGYNNGGFWKENIYGIHYKPNYPIYHPPKTISFHYEPAPFTYYSDGTGRDTYVIKNNAGLTKKFKSLNQYRLKDFLRTPESCIFNFKSNPMKEGYRAKTIYVSEKELSRNKHIKTIENGLVKRLYKDEKYKFIHYIVKTYEPKNVTEKLSDFELLSFKDFLAEMKKVKVKLSAPMQKDLLEIYDASVESIIGFTRQIDIKMKELDNLVFEIYNISDGDKEFVLQ